MKPWARLGLCTMLMFSSVAFGHAKLLRTEPAAAAQLSTAPKSLTLNFNEPVKLAMLKLTSAGRSLPVTVARDAAAAASVTVALPPLPGGSYEVQWSALTPSDGHVVKGGFNFTVQ
jgi:methionine-rich copper-binding protein CopC